MNRVLDTPVPSLSRRARVASTSLLAVLALALSACATTVPGAAPTSTDTPSPTASVPPSPTASPTATPTSDPSPDPSESATTGEPFNGEILVITSELRDGSLEVTAMVPGVSESDGTCTLTLEPSAESVSVSGAEGKDVTYCGLMSIPVSDATDVAFTVSYRSARLNAQSDTTTLETTP